MIETLSGLMKDEECPYYLHRGEDDTNTRYLTDISLSYQFYVLKSPKGTTVVASDRDKDHVEEETNHNFKSYEELLGIDSGAILELNIADELDSVLELLYTENIQNVRVSPDFPSYITDGLRDQEIGVKVLEKDILTESRMYKSEEEIQHLRDIQELTETVMKRIKDMISRSQIGHQDELVLDGEILTSERVKEEARSILEEHDAEMKEEMIVSCGSDSDGPHNRGSGRLEAHKPILCDVFPKGSHGYFGDMSRTFVKGEPSEELARIHSTVENALKECLEQIEKGEAHIHDVASEAISDKGYQTEVGAENGLIHFVGHGVGLDIHEKPSLNGECESLENGMVITVEPAVYKKGKGGVRIEDLVVVRENGLENLNSMNYDLVVE